MCRPRQRTKFELLTDFEQSRNIGLLEGGFSYHTEQQQLVRGVTATQSGASLKAVDR